MTTSVMIGPDSEAVRRSQEERSVVDEIPVIELVNPMPGFPEHRRFALVRLDDDGMLCALRSLEDPDLRFLVTSPISFFPDYAPLVEDDVVDQLGIVDAAEVLVLVVLTAGSSLAETTANLLAPILVNTQSRRASQVILDDPSLSVATPLVA
ncbi:flagellar assembly protein FliW [Nocardioides solisilvae]|uniref:flagellar assembly protein FliW n=1 Tax=Nocardioides solisilvae TaxID=1542435 RepID=UPI001EF712F5|nr:flagellar assembly protein FliW [Nocardioides solisilvae]